MLDNGCHASSMIIVARESLSERLQVPVSSASMRASVWSENHMRLGYFTMPVHPMHRDWSETLRQDREAIILADQLGFYDAFVGEHLTDRCENVTNSMMFLATLIPETRQIKLATGTANIAQTHPVLLAVQAAMFDHLAQGRFVFGISPGALTSDAEALGILD